MSPNELKTFTSAPQDGIFQRLIGRGRTVASDASHTPFEPEGPIEELIVSGAAFGIDIYSIINFSHKCDREGYGLFNLMLSILPTKIK